jgi:hypothetical protein
MEENRDQRKETVLVHDTINVHTAYQYTHLSPSSLSLFLLPTLPTNTHTASLSLSLSSYLIEWTILAFSPGSIDVPPVRTTEAYLK